MIKLANIYKRLYDTFSLQTVNFYLQRGKQMQDYAINNLMVMLSGKIPDENLKIVKEAVTIWLKDYTVTEQKTELMVRAENICKELQDYVVAKKVEGKSEGTLKQYAMHISNLIYFTNKPVKEISTGDIMAFLYSKQKSGVKDITVDNVRTSINAFYTWLVSCDYIAKNPCAQIGKIKHEKNTRQPLSAVDLERLRDAARNPQERAIIEVLYSTGCRVSELANLKITDVNMDLKEVNLFGKGKKHRTSYLNARAVVALQAYWDDRKGASEYVICSQRKPYGPITPRRFELILKELKERAGIDGKVTPHIIRHTTATDAIDKGMPIEQVQKLLGHEEIATTLIYAKVRNENVKQGHQKYIV